MMLYFLESGIDSLKKGFDNLIKYEEFYFEKKGGKERFYHLKDAILFIQHGIEILLKQILISQSEYLIFSQIDDNVKKAYKEKQTKNLKSVFESSLKNKIHTVSFNEAIERLKMTAKFTLSNKLENKIRELESYRNIIMHSEVHLNEIDIQNTFDGLSDDLDFFFMKNIGSKYKTISGYSSLLKNYSQYKNLLQNKNSHLKSEVFRIFLEIFKHCGLSIGNNDVKRVTDINLASTFLELLFKSQFQFGTDLYNGFCSGNVKYIKRIDAKTFSMYTDDNNAFFDFSFRSLIIYLPKIESDLSPIIFLESENDQIDESLNPLIFEHDNIKSIKSFFSIKNKKSYYNSKDLDEIYNNVDFSFDDWEMHTRFLTRGLFCFMNIQNLEFNRNLKYFIKDYKFLDGKEFEVFYRKMISNN